MATTLPLLILRRVPRTVFRQCGIQISFNTRVFLRLASSGYPTTSSSISAPLSRHGNGKKGCETCAADDYPLLSTSEKVGKSEDSLFEQQVMDVQEWWAR